MGGGQDSQAASLPTPIYSNNESGYTVGVLALASE